MQLSSVLTSKTTTGPIYNVITRMELSKLDLAPPQNPLLFSMSHISALLSLNSYLTSLEKAIIPKKTMGVHECSRVIFYDECYSNHKC